ncbi:MAG: hypothetical protein B6I23_02190 [Rickettsiaceae bacterium 4572_127]|nr:MAG: hypothetical protein B6I23_02190 [Rickettsiaceae bacterium 4572_127]
MKNKGDDMREIVIIGGGIAGMSAGIYASVKGGSLTQSHEIENYPGFVDAIPCTQLTDAMENQALRLGAEFANETVEKISGEEGSYTLHTKSKKEIKAKTVIIATGTRPRPLNAKGMKEFFGKGISACAVCDGFFYKNKSVAIIGGGNTALYEALYLSKICKKVYILNRRDKLTAEAITQEKVSKLENVEVILNTELQEAKGTRFLEKITVVNNKTNSTSEIEIDGLFVAIGVLPNTEFLKDFIELNKWGFVKTQGVSTATNKKGIFVAGDITANMFQQVVISAGTGASAGLEAEHYLHSLKE